MSCSSIRGSLSFGSGIGIFHKDNGEPRNYGYVLATEHGGEWFKTKQEAIKKKEEA